MSDKVEIDIAHPVEEGQPGDRATVSPERAAKLVEAGVARYAPKSDHAKK